MTTAEIANWLTAVALSVGVLQLYLSRRQSRASFEQEFVRRYWQICDDRDLGEAQGDVFLRRYLRLCEDEFEIVGLGQVSASTWAIWHSAISVEVRAIGRETVWAHANDLGGLEWTRKCLESPEAHEARACAGFRDSRSASRRYRLSLP